MCESEDAISSVGDAKRRLKEGTVSSEDMVRSALNKIQKRDGQLNAFVAVFAEKSISKARNFDDRDESEQACLPLGGIPVAVKDLFDYEGQPTRAGSRSTSAEAALSSATCVKKLEAAGAIVLGKTQTVEFAFGGWGTNPVVGTPWNPWDKKVHRVPGGSSSGSAVAVASGMVMAALGTDTGGSVRTPASFCGLVGTKTSTGLISRHGVFPLCPTHDTVGTLTRNVRDAACLLQAISGQDANDPETLNAPRIDFISGLHDGVEEMKIAVLETTELDAAEDDIRHLYEKALGTLEKSGAVVRPYSLPRTLMSYLEDAGRLMSSESYASLRDLIEPKDSGVDPAIRERVLIGKQISTKEYDEMLVQRKQAGDAFLKKLGDVKALIMPTCPSTAIPVAEVDETAIVTPFGRFVNYLDLAALSVPIGLARNGLPVGLQIVVRKFDDALALQIAQVIETAVGTFTPEKHW